MLVRVVKVLTACELSIRHFLYFVNTKSKEILFIFDEYFINLTTVVRLRPNKKPWSTDQGFDKILRG